MKEEIKSASLSITSEPEKLLLRDGTCFVRKAEGAYGGSPTPGQIGEIQGHFSDHFSCNTKAFAFLGADPVDGDATFNPILMLLDNPLVDTSLTPSSDGAFYALPSVKRLTLNQAYVYWPLSTDLEAGLLSASDHRMVVIDVALEKKKKQPVED